MEKQQPLQYLKVYTHNVARVLKPSQDGELAHAIHETLHYSLDGNEDDYLISRSQLAASSCAPSSSASAGKSSSDTFASQGQNGKLESDSEEVVHPGFVATNDPDRPYASYMWNEKSSLLTLPHPSTIDKPLLSDPCTASDNEADLRDAFDVTTKFFYFSDAKVDGNSQESYYPAEWIDEALGCLATATGLKTADTFIIAFPKLKLDCPHASDEQIYKKATKVADVWKRISTDKRILSLGLSDVSQRSLRAFVSQLDCPSLPPEEAELGTNEPIEIPSSPSKVSLGPDRLDERTELIRVYGPGPCRRPRLCTINLREQNCDDNSLGGRSVSKTSANASSCWDRGLAEYCKEENVLLVAHNDQKDILPERCLPTLLGEFEGRIPHAMSSNKRLEPVWLLKYTVLIRDRGVLADKGFVLFCKTVEA
ncbi:uncharacterized protein FA14DRAFT_122921 [Meira miltonrushii]|uniref:Glutamate--cysteine ligase modifier subunit n=1 Tax=Meira miltonrushii TaxID=1280837 RepID=A0A316VBJ2_9BASI|nr:uncharacterized protein FA14DRAFT_122921 [Meira miltonrushii]PWN34840.1 hypothetical protein FA14DRAFT_122921 [Meira miltonrushii]